MMYDVELSRNAEHCMDRLDQVTPKRMILALDRLVKDPFMAPNVKPLKGQADHYRLRVGDWRIIYRIQEERLLISVISIIGSRGDVYKK